METKSNSHSQSESASSEEVLLLGQDTHQEHSAHEEHAHTL